MIRLKNIKHLFDKENFSSAFCYLWIGVCLILFTLLRVKHSRYMLPCCPAIAILTAKIFAEAENIPLKSKFTGFKISIFLTIFFFLGVSILAGLGLVDLGSSNLVNYISPAFLIFGVFTLLCFYQLQIN